MNALVQLHVAPRIFRAVAPPPQVSASGRVTFVPVVDLRTDSSAHPMSDDQAVRQLMAHLARVQPQETATVLLGDRLPASRLCGVLAEHLATGGLVLHLAPWTTAAWREWAHAHGWVIE